MPTRLVMELHRVGHLEQADVLAMVAARASRDSEWKESTGNAVESADARLQKAVAGMLHVRRHGSQMCSRYMRFQIHQEAE